MTLPFDFGNNQLTATDFYRHELQFCQTLLELFNCQTVQIIHLSPSGDLKTAGGTTDYPETLKAGINLALQQRQPVVDQERRNAFLPILADDLITAMAVLSGGSPTLYANTPDWFKGRGRQADREFRLLKQWSIDPGSGLLNAMHLYREIKLLTSHAAESDNAESKARDGKPGEFGPHLFLVEVAPRAQDAAQALLGISRTGAYLDSLLGAGAPLHHLGAGIFGLLWPKANEKEAQKLGYAILRKLKRYNTAKAHIGIAPLLDPSIQPADGKNADPLAKAWQALKTARQRGVFALCSAASLNPQQQQLPAPAAATLTHFQKIWRGENQFAVIILQKDMDTQEKFSGRVLSLAGEEAAILPINRREVFIYLPGADEEQARKWAVGLGEKIKQLGIGSYSQGIANYPCPGFKKTDIPLNARKALAHAYFYGPGSITSFEAISLNISGDIYYNEGDLNSAIREYRLGLNLDPHNINLLNSLGVIYAQIERYKMALPLFERILSINPGDFMALFNLGFAHLRGGGREQALNYFEKAMAVDDNYFDLLLQLGQMYCAMGQYQKAVRVLSKAEKTVSAKKKETNRETWEYCEPWHESGNGLGHDLVYRYLGEAYKGINQHREAITCLQRATRYNSRDAQALSLLGELYALEKQGAEIAISLCNQAVELDGGNAGHWRRLAFTLFQGGDLEAALEAAKTGLRLAPKDQETMLLLVNVYQEKGLLPQARNILGRILKLDGTNKAASRLLKQINTKKRLKK